MSIDVSRRPISISVVVPVLNEADNVKPLIREVREALGSQHIWELVLVDDGSDDETASIITELGRHDSRIRLVSLARRYGQSTAMQAGFDHARGDVVVTMDGDLQNDPRDIPRLVAALDEHCDLVAGYRERRKDPLIRRKLPSWIANRIIGWITGVPIRDNGCSLKAYRRELLERMRLYSDMHRFIPALAAGTAGARIRQIPVRHHPRQRGESKYGLERVAKVLADLITVKMIRSFRSRPLLLFGSGATLSLVLTVLFGAATLLAHASFQQFKAESVVFPSVALLFAALGAFLLMTGLVGEVAVRHYERENPAPPLLLHESRP